MSCVQRLEQIKGFPAAHLTDNNPVWPVAQGDAFEPLLDSEEAAALLKIHPKTLQKMARSGEIVGIQVGRLWRSGHQL